MTHGLAPRAGVAHRINAERVLILAWPRAILLQLAHPLVAAGVAGHSSFRAGAGAAAGRLHATIKAMLRLTYAADADRARTIEAIRAIHRRVHGRLADAVGPFAAGTPYSAEDPALLLWVHTTLLDSVLPAYDVLVAPLAASLRDEYCDEAASVAVDLGVPPAEVPRTWAALQAHLTRVRASGVIAVGRDARAVSAAVLAPPLGVWAAPVVAINRRLTIGWLPPDIRTHYGFVWGPADEAAHARLVRRLRRVRRHLPRALAYWRVARRR